MIPLVEQSINLLLAQLISAAQLEERYRQFAIKATDQGTDEDVQRFEALESEGRWKVRKILAEILWRDVHR